MIAFVKMNQKGMDINMKIDISGIPLIDNHGHPFPAGRQSSYERNFALSTIPQETCHVHSTLFFQMCNRRLRRTLGLSENCSLEELLKTREEMLKSDRKGYIDFLWKDVNYTGMVADIGCPVSKELLTKEELDEFDCEMTGFFLRKVNRIEWVAEDVVEEGDYSFEDFTRLYVEGLKEKIRREQLVGLKSIIAYKTGLQIHVLSEEKFRQGYYLYLSDRGSRKYEKIFRDYCFCKACEVCEELGIPIQVHTAIGDSPMLDLQKCNPIFLYEVINAYPNTVFVLLHAGYPYCEELGMMLQQYGNVYGDASALVPYASIAGASKLKALMEMAPMTKLLFGTDAGGIPEQFWYAAFLFRSFFTDALQELVDKDFISGSFAMETAENVMYKNTVKLYKKR